MEAVGGWNLGGGRHLSSHALQPWDKPRGRRIEDAYGETTPPPISDRYDVEFEDRSFWKKTNKCMECTTKEQKIQTCKQCHEDLPLEAFPVSGTT